MKVSSQLSFASDAARVAFQSAANQALPLEVADPSVAGVDVPEGLFGRATDGSLWYKNGAGATAWGPVLDADGKVVFELATTEDAESGTGTGVMTSELTAAAIDAQARSAKQTSSVESFNHTLSQTAWSKAAKFTFTKTTAPVGTVNVGGGATHVRFLRWDGTWSAVKAVSGNTSFSAADWGAAPAAPYNSLIPKFGAIVPCNSGGTVLGDLTYLHLNNNQLTSFDGTGLNALDRLSLQSNQITSFDGTGLGALTYLNLSSNQLTSFDSTGMSELTDLFLNSNQLTSFNGTGLNALTKLFLSSNHLTSFNGTGMSALTYLHLGFNHLTSFDSAGLNALTDLFLNSNQLTSFDSTGMSALATLYLSTNQLTEVRVVGLSTDNGYSSMELGFNFGGNLLDAAALNQIYTDLAAGTGWIGVNGNPGTSADDPTIATAKGYTVYGS